MVVRGHVAITRMDLVNGYDQRFSVSSIAGVTGMEKHDVLSISLGLVMADHWVKHLTPGCRMQRLRGIDHSPVLVFSCIGGVSGMEVHEGFLLTSRSCLWQSRRSI